MHGIMLSDSILIAFAFLGFFLDLFIRRIEVYSEKIYTSGFLLLLVIRIT